MQHFEINQLKYNEVLLIKHLQTANLKFMHIRKRKPISRTFLRIKTYRNPLNNPDVIHRTFLFKIRQGDLSGILGDPNRRDRCRHFLNQCQPLFTVLIIAPVDQFFLCRTTESS